MSLMRDLRQALRSLRRERIFTFAAVLVLTLGIGPVTILLSLVNAVLFRPWPVTDPSSMAIIRPQRAGQEVSGVISIAEYRYLREHSKTIMGMAAWKGGVSRIDDGAGQRVSVQSGLVNADYFRVLGGGIVAGRSFLPDEENYRAPKAVAIISERLWRGRFGSNRAVIGSSIRLGGEPFRIVGVAARGFSDPHRRTIPTELWMPLPARAIRGGSPKDLARFTDPRGETLGLLAGRLAPGATHRLAAAELSLLSRRFREAASLPSAGIAVIDTRPMSEYRPGEVRTVLTGYIPLLFAVVLVLFVACANVANLLLVRTLSRRHEIAIRLLLGARRGRVVRQLLVEATVLSAAAGGLALGLAFVAPRMMIGLGLIFGPRGFERISSRSVLRTSLYTPDPLVSWLVVLIVGLTAVLAGLMPALRASRGDLRSIAAESHGRTASGARWGASLLAAQVALTTVLLSGAMVLTRSIDRVASQNPGFRIKDVQTVSIEHGMPPGSELHRIRAFFLSLRDSVQQTSLGPVGVSEEPPFSDLPLFMMARRPNDALGDIHQILMRRVSRNYFAVLNLPIVQGQAPESDVDSHEIVVNETAARMLWPNADPIGQTLLSAVSRTEFESYRVVGVARDVPVRTMSEIEPVIYRNPDWVAATLLLPSPTAGAAARVRAVAAQLAPNVKVTERPLADYIREGITLAVLARGAAWVVSGLGLILAMVGAFGTFAHTVAQRRREIGIRMALGARANEVAALVFRGAGRSLIGGFALGFLLALMAVPSLRHVLYGLDAFDPVAYLEVALVFGVAAGLSTWVPVRRATSVDPVRTLRAD
jgi:predicted permease